MQLQKTAIIEKHTLFEMIPPPPPEGSGCDYFCDLSGTNPDEQIKIFGVTDYGARCYIQQIDTGRTPWTRICFVANKGKETCDEPLILGVVKESVANDPSLFFDTANWEKLWAGEQWTAVGLSSDILPEVNKDYWIYFDVDYPHIPGEALFFVVITNEQDSITGWRSGAMRHGECFGNCYYGIWNGSFEWTDALPSQVMSIVHTEDGAVFEGRAIANNIDFPATAQNNEEWPWYFELANELMGFCGCPETLWFKIWQLDGLGGEPVGDPLFSGEGELPCGYYFPVAGSIIFDEMGGYDFYGRLDVGHMEGDDYVRDRYGYFQVHVNCTEGAWGCDENGDKWVCTNGVWVKQTPSPHPDCVPQCSDYTTQSTCEANKCYWWNGSCHDSSPSCSEINNQTDCLAYDCYWYDGSCHSGPSQPEICDWIDAQGGPTGLDIANIFVIIDSYIYNTPPNGYTFIPTLQNVFGVIDYYLGFDGDEKTGCDYY